MNLLFWYRSLMRSVGAALVKLIVTATSGLVSFTTNVIRPVKVTCEFSPVQEGTGDPSPDNVRPISGWDGCEILKARKNLLKPVSDSEFWQNGYIKNNGVVTADNSYRVTDFISIRPGIDYTFLVWQIDEITSFDGWKGIAFYDGNKTFIPGSFWQGTISQLRHVVSPDNAMYVRVYTVPETCPQLGIETTVTAYEPYQGATLPITFTDPTTGDPLTVYGGTVTLNEDGSADLVATQALWVEDGTRQPTYAVWKTSGEGDLYNNTLFGHLPRPQHDYAGGYEEYFSSDNRKFTPSINSSEWRNKFCFASYRAAGASFAYSIPKNLSTKAEVAAYFAENPTTVVYPLATPVTYHFDNIGQLQSFLGTNNIWHSMNGDITVEYWIKQ